MEELIWSLVDKTERLLNSNFSAALAGAFAGAWAADRIARRSRREDQVRREIIATNAAIELANVVCSGAIVMKKKNVIPLKTKYDEQRAIAVEHDRRKRAGQVAQNSMPAVGELYFPIFDVLRVPVDELGSEMKELTISGRARPMYTGLAQSVATVNLVIGLHNDIVNSVPSMSSDEKIARIFALQRNGVTDEKYKLAIEQLNDRINDCIWFSDTLMQDLIAYGDTVEQKRWFRNKKHTIRVLSFDAEVRNQYFPPDTDYPDWVNYGKKKPAEAAEVAADQGG